MVRADFGSALFLLSLDLSCDLFFLTFSVFLYIIKEICEEQGLPGCSRSGAFSPASPNREPDGEKMIVAVAIVLILIAFFSLFLDSGFIQSPRLLHILLDALLFLLSLVVLVRSIILYKIGEKEMLSKKVRDLEAKVDFLTKREEERMKLPGSEGSAKETEFPGSGT